jgi:integrase
MTRSTRKRPDFVSPSQKAKTAVVQQIARLARRAHLDYDGFLYVCQQARRKLGLRKPRRERRLPQLLTEAELKRFFDVIQNCGDVQHEIMLKLLFYTAVRVSELVRIEVADVDLKHNKIFIDRGKGAKDRVWAAAHTRSYVPGKVMCREWPGSTGDTGCQGVALVPG